MELELKHLAPYLPYGLKWKFDGEDLTHDIVGLDITNRGVKLISPYNDYGDCVISSGKPLLLTMSSLYTEMEDGTVPIVEIYKKMFVWPQIKEYKIEDGCLKFGKHTFEWVEEFRAFSLDGETAYILIEVSDYLDENHFDWRYGLIDKGLALDKTKIK